MLRFTIQSAKVLHFTIQSSKKCKNIGQKSLSLTKRAFLGVFFSGPQIINRKRLLLQPKSHTMDKKETRKHIRALKKEFPSEARHRESARIWEQLEQHPLFQQSHCIFIYWSMDDEVYTPDFIRKWQNQKEFILPCVVGDELELKRFDGEQVLKEGENFRIPEPVGVALDDYSCIDLAIVPGMAFDAKYHRLGRGRGYYDKTLCRIAAPKIGVCFGFQFLDEVPTDTFDISMDEIIHG